MHRSVCWTALLRHGTAIEQYGANRQVEQQNHTDRPGVQSIRTKQQADTPIVSGFLSLFPLQYVLVARAADKDFDNGIDYPCDHGPVGSEWAPRTLCNALAAPGFLLEPCDDSS